jgi:hypothetical protein
MGAPARRDRAAHDRERQVCSVTGSTFNAPYVVALVVLCGAGLTWVQLRYLHDPPWSVGAFFRDAARSPAAVVLIVCLILVSALWIIAVRTRLSR